MLPRFQPGHHRRESDQTAKQRKTDRNHQQNAHARRTTVARDGKTLNDKIVVSALKVTARGVLVCSNDTEPEPPRARMTM